jgi:hypothetical protein
MRIPTIVVLNRRFPRLVFQECANNLEVAMLGGIGCWCSLFAVLISDCDASTPIELLLNGKSRGGVISGDYLHSVRIRSFSST